VKRVDLNCDLGEDDSASGMQREAQILPLVTSANVACGFHAGGPAFMRHTMAAAAALGVALGAHPSLADREHFGRRELPVDPERVYEDVLYQVGAAAAIARSLGAPLNHVKPHGALYNMAARDPALAEAVARAVRDFDAGLVLFGLSGSQLPRAGEALGLRCASEVFADRTYQPDGSLTPRSCPGALIEDAHAAAAQVMQMVRDGILTALDGTKVPIVADTVCIHGDAAQAPLFASILRSSLETQGIAVGPVRRAS
jgi:5-oxoprolinase (ATP-hydrolysing) subunit A